VCAEPVLFKRCDNDRNDGSSGSYAQNAPPTEWRLGGMVGVWLGMLAIVGSKYAMN